MTTQPPSLREQAISAIERAELAVDDLCHGARWTMRVPAEPDRDHDLIISEALRLARAALATPSAPVEGLREALGRLVAAALDYSPRNDHDWRCEYRTAESGYVEGGLPVIRCECGFETLGLAVRDAQDALAAIPPAEPGAGLRMPCVEDGSHSDDLSHEAEYRNRTGRHAPGAKR